MEIGINNERGRGGACRRIYYLGHLQKQSHDFKYQHLGLRPSFLVMLTLDLLSNHVW